jgi:predicted transcriptional regulator
MTEREKKSRGKGRSVNPAHQTITRKLQELYEAVKEEEIPEHFLELLERLDAADAAFTKRNASEEQGV